MGEGRVVEERWVVGGKVSVSRGGCEGGRTDEEGRREGRERAGQEGEDSLDLVRAELGVDDGPDDVVRLHPGEKVRSRVG